jgi:hypothetical protein
LFQNGNPNIEEFKVSSNRALGMCGNMDGVISNDWRTCDKLEVTPNDAGSLVQIADSCKDGTHDAQGYVGGTKLDKTAMEAGF